MSEQNESQKGGMLFKILTIVFALAIAGLIYWSMSTQKELNGLLTEKENLRVELKTELDQLMVQHNDLKANNETLSAYLTEKDSVIQENAKQIEEGLRYKWSYFNIKKQLTELQEVASVYEAKIDDLKLENQILMTENTEIKGQFAAEQQKTSQLTMVKNELTEKVEIASELKTYTVTAVGIRAKSNGKESVTDKHKRTDRIKVCFLLGSNALRAAGNLDIYVRIAQPDDVILTHGDDYSFDYNGQKLQYSIKTTVDYNKLATTVCCYFDKADGQEFVAGNYKLEIYEGNTVIGHASYNLR